MYDVNDDGTISGRKAVMGALRLYLDFINLFLMASWMRLRPQTTPIRYSSSSSPPSWALCWVTLWGSYLVC
jgi:hypothetical protein